MLSAEALRARLGATMASARRKVQDLLRPHRLNERFQSELLAQLMHHQPPSSRRVPVENIDAFVRMKRPPHNNICLFAIMRSGHTLDVSWLRSVRNLYGRHDEEAEATRRVIAAFRNEIHTSSPMMREARARFTVGPCGECGKRRKLAIDHAGTPFAQILDGFLISARADWLSFLEAASRPPPGDTDRSPPPFIPSSCIGSIALRWYNGAHILADRMLAKQWCDWHEARAQLVGLCKPCNSSKGSGGYRYSFSQGVGPAAAAPASPAALGNTRAEEEGGAGAGMGRTGLLGVSRKRRRPAAQAGGEGGDDDGKEGSGCSGSIMKAAIKKRQKKKTTTKTTRKSGRILTTLAQSRKGRGGRLALSRARRTCS